MAGNSLIGSLAVNLTMETAAFQRGAANAEKRATTLKQKLGGLGDSMKSFGAGLVSGVIVGGITSVVSSAFEMASALSEAAEKAGLTVEGLQRLRLAASQTGVSNETMESSIVKLNKTLGDLQLGSQSAQKAFAAIGLSAEQLKGMKTEDAFRLIAEQLSRIPDVQTRVAIGTQIFGRNFSQLLPLINGGAKAIDDFTEASKRNGEITTQDAQKLDELGDRWDQFKTRVGVATANFIARTVSAAEATDAFLAKIQNWAKETDASIAQWAQSTWSSFEAWHGKVQAGFNSMRDRSIAALQRLYEGAKTWLMDKLGAVADWVGKKLGWLGDQFYKLYDVVIGHSYVPDMVNGIGQEFARLQGEMVDPTVDATDRAAEGFANMATSAVNSVQGIIGALKNKDWLSAIEQAINLLSQLGVFAGIGSSGGGKDTGNGDGGGKNVPKFASGGSFQFGGKPGVDRNVLSLNGSPIAKVSRGEWGHITPQKEAGSSARGGTTVIVNAQDAVLAETVKGWIQTSMQAAAAAGSADAIDRFARQKRRALA